MKTYKTIIFTLCLLTATAHAQEDDKGIIFKIGEKIMNLGGFSYLELEKKFAKSDKGLAECLTESAQMKFQRDKKDEELKACQSGGAAPAPGAEQPAATSVDGAAPASP